MRQKSGTVKEPAEKVFSDTRRATSKQRSAGEKIRFVLAEMETVQTAVYKGERGVHFMKAIPVQKACLGCHGSKLAPGVAGLRGPGQAAVPDLVVAGRVRRRELVPLRGRLRLGRLQRRLAGRRCRRRPGSSRSRRGPECRNSWTPRRGGAR